MAVFPALERRGHTLHHEGKERKIAIGRVVSVVSFIDTIIKTTSVCYGSSVGDGLVLHGKQT